METIKIKKYVIRFSLIYITSVIAIFILSTLFDVDGSVGATVAITIASAMYAVNVFISDHKRAPSKSEKSTLVWQSLLVTFLFSIVMFIIIIAPILNREDLTLLLEATTQTHLFIYAGSSLFAILLQWALLAFSYGSMANKLHANLLKKGKI